MVEVRRLVPIRVNDEDEIVLFSALPSLGQSLGRFQDANGPDSDLSVEVVARARLSVCHSHHHLREAASPSKVRTFSLLLGKKKQIPLG